MEKLLALEGGIRAVLYQSARGVPANGIIFVMMHDNGDFLQHPATAALPQAGFDVLAATVSYAPDPEDRRTDFNVALANLGEVVAFARRLPMARRVILIGHSSGAALAAAYQNIAENGAISCQGPEKIVPCPDSLAGLIPADGLVLLDPILGNAANFLTSVDPALAEGAEFSDLDVLNPSNGFSPNGARFGPAFIKRFLEAQAARNADIVEQARKRLAALEQGKARFADDEPFRTRPAWAV